MKRFMAKVCMLLVCAGLLSSPAVVIANGVCASMKISHIGMSAAAPSGVEMWLTNVSGATCGAIPANGVAHFYLSTTNTDKTLAVLLTAASLKKNVWTFSVGGAAPYTLASVSILNVTD